MKLFDIFSLLAEVSSVSFECDFVAVHRVMQVNYNLTEADTIIEELKKVIHLARIVQ